MKGNDMRVLQEKAIRPVLDQVPELPGQVGDVGASVARSAGHDAGVHPARRGARRRTGNKGRLKRFAFAFCRHAGEYEFEHFLGQDELEARTKARAWGASKGLIFDGQLSERGLAIAKSV